MLQQSDIYKVLKMRHKYTDAEIAINTRHTRRTVSKYLKDPQLKHAERLWKTRKNPFESIEDEIKGMLQINPTLEAKTLLDFFIEKYPGRFQEGQLRTLQRFAKRFKALEGPAKEVMFAQKHEAGKLAASDFTSMNDLKITIDGQPFFHLLYHFVLTYSNWEWARICHSESFESLRAGLKEALTRLGKIPEEHLTDSLTAAFNNMQGEFQKQYQELLSMWKIKGRVTQPASPNENGDVEQRNYRLKRAIDQALMLRGSRNFQTKGQYSQFLYLLLMKLNDTRQQLLQKELEIMSPLPEALIPDYTLIKTRVSSCSTIRIKNCSYSLPSRLIGEEVEVHLHDDSLEIFYVEKPVLTCDRLRGENKHKIDYRHVIESLRRKPGAFKSYRYREDLFLSSVFKIAYEYLLQKDPLHASKIYLEILYLCMTNGQDRVERVLSCLLKQDEGLFTLQEIQRLAEKENAPDIRDVYIQQPNLQDYDEAFGLGGSL